MSEQVREPEELFVSHPEKPEDVNALVKELVSMPSRRMFLNLGPAHPSSHGTLRVLLELDGERVADAVPEIGYLHRGFEKHSENSTWTQVIPYTDRLNYVSPLMNNVGYAMAVEKLMDIEIPPRAKAIRLIICEMNRIMDHLVTLGICLTGIGAITNFFYTFNVREEFTKLQEELTGARLTTTYTRVGGLAYDLPDDFLDKLRGMLKKLYRALSDVEGLAMRNRIFLDRTVGLGKITAEEAISYGFTGPSLRACGVNYDVRRAHPYYGYDGLDFEIPLGQDGDTYDRIMVRFYEIEQSARILEQMLTRVPDGPIRVSDPRITLPEKQDVYGSIEGLMNQFKLIIEGIRPPKGEVYSYTEAANGELGFYIVSDGTGVPYRVRCRPPCLLVYSAFKRLIKGHLIADVVAILDSLQIIAGELDR